MLFMLHRHVGLSRPFYVNKIYSFIHTEVWARLALLDTWVCGGGSCLHGAGGGQEPRSRTFSSGGGGGGVLKP